MENNLPDGVFFKLLHPPDMRVFWPTIRYAVLRAAPPTAGTELSAMRTLLMQLLTGEAQAWVLYESDTQTLYSVLVTYIGIDQMTKDKYLMLYALYNYALVPQDMWLACLDLLGIYANNNGAHRIIALSGIERVVERLRTAGFEDAFRVLHKEV